MCKTPLANPKGRIPKKTQKKSGKIEPKNMRSYALFEHKKSPPNMI